MAMQPARTGMTAVAALLIFIATGARQAPRPVPAEAAPLALKADPCMHVDSARRRSSGG